MMDTVDSPKSLISLRACPFKIPFKAHERRQNLGTPVSTDMAFNGRSINDYLLDLEYFFIMIVKSKKKIDLNLFVEILSI